MPRSWAFSFRRRSGRRVAEACRRLVRGLRLARLRAMSLSLRPKRLSRYKDIAALALKYARGGVLAGARHDPLVPDPEHDEEEPESGGEADAKGLELASDLERLGPTYVKLGQLLSSRADLLPTAYLDALRRLQDDVEPFSYEEVESIVESELGARISKAFASF